MISDKDILQAIGRDADGGFRLLMRTYMEPVYWHVRRMVVSLEDAQDVTQETFVRVFRFIHSFSGDSSLKTWLLSIATNEALRWLGRRANVATLSLDDTTAQLVAADTQIEGDAIEARLQRAILRLPAKQQLAFNLRYYDEMSYDDIATVLQSSPNAAKTNYHLAKEKIIQYMNQND